MESNKQPERILQPHESIIAGGIAGFSQSIVSLPFWAMKVRTQCGYSFTLDPRILYKGFGAATGSIAFMSVAQVFFSTIVHQHIHADSKASASDSTERIMSAFSGGVLSTVISNPVGIVVTQQHKHTNTTFRYNALRLYKQYGFRRFYISFLGNGVVNSTFTLGFYGIYPSLQNNFQYHFPNKTMSSIMTGLALGFITGIISQPFDTTKTLQENDADITKKPLSHYFKSIYKRQGIRGFYVGFFPAALATSTATICAGMTVEAAEDYFANKKRKIS